MDQLRKAWAVLARHHFWVLIVVTTLIAAYFWNRGASELSAQFKANKGKIDQGFTAIAGVRSLDFKANPDVTEKQQAQIDIQQKQVHDMWQELYDRQRAEVLKWPSNLSEQFRGEVEKKKFLDEIPPDLRDHYNNYIRDHFPDLPKIVGAKLAAEGEVGSMSRGGRGSARGAMGGRGEFGPGMTGAEAGAVDEEEYLVDWLDQDRIRQQLYVPSTPSAKRIWKTQEDLWVYEALLKIIAATNKAAKADRNSNAAVRVIESMEVGQPAAKQSRSRGRIEMVAPPAAGGEMGAGEFGGEMGGGRGGEMMGGGGGFTGGETMGGEFGGERGGAGMPGEGEVDLFSGRYIDASGQPIAGEEPAQFGKEFKRLPIRLQLVMDERWLPQLISECANAALQVDVQEVRINPSMEGNSGGGYSSRGGMSMSGQSGEAMIPEAEPAVKTVVIQGIIYIFNPPSEAAGPGQVAGVQ